jgi:O-antigen ligase
MGFLFTQVFIAFALLTAAAFGGAGDVHIALVLGILATLVGLAYIPSASVMRLHQPYLLVSWVFVTALSLVPIYVSGAMYAVNEQMPFAIACLLIMLTLRTRGQLTSIAYVLWALCSFVICMGFSDLHNGIIGRYVLTEGVRVADKAADVSTLTYRFMGLGTIHDPNDFGQLLVVTIPLLGLRWKRGAHVTNFLLTVLPAAFLLLGVYYTRSRGTAVALLVLLFFLFKDKLGVLGSALTGFATLAVLVGAGLTGGRGMADDDGSRVALWSQCLTAFRSHPLLGVGWNNAPDYTDNHLTSHNTFVVDFTETGLIGYFVFIAILLSCWYTTTNMINLWEERKKKQGEADETRASSWSRPAQDRPAMAAPALAANGAITMPDFFPTAPMARTASPAISSLRSPNAPSRTPVAPNRTPVAPIQTSAAPMPFMKFGAPQPPDEPLEAYAHAAFCLRLSFIALLTSGFFLSRAYSLPIYIVIGMTAALAAMSPVPISPSIAKVFKATPVVMFVTILAIYLFIRLHGIH